MCTSAGLSTVDGHVGFAPAVHRVRAELVRFLLDAGEAGKMVVGYGAPGKGNTLLNYCGVRPDLLPSTVDRNRYKHGRCGQLVFPIPRLEVVTP